MFSFLRHKEVQIRKKHTCFGCGIEYSVGHYMFNSVMAGEGVIQNTYWCQVCQAFMDQSADDFIDGVELYEFRHELNYQIFKKDYLFPTRMLILEKMIPDKKPNLLL